MCKPRQSHKHVRSHSSTDRNLPISPDIQWEVIYPEQPATATQPKKLAGRVDILKYDHNSQSVPVRLIEVKRQAQTGDPATTAAAATVIAAGQVLRYFNDLPVGDGYTKGLYTFPAGLLDSFII